METKKSWKIVLETYGDAQKVLHAMREIIENFSVVTIADLYELVGLPGHYTFSRMGWSTLDAVEIRAAEEKGWFVDFPEPEVIP